MNAAKERASPKRPPKQRTNSESGRALAENVPFRHGQSIVWVRMKVKRQGTIAPCTPVTSPDEALAPPDRCA